MKAKLAKNVEEKLFRKLISFPVLND